MREFIRVVSREVACDGRPRFQARVTAEHFADPTRIRRARERAAADVNWALDHLQEAAADAHAAGLTRVEAWNKNAYKPGEYPGPPSGACVPFHVDASGQIALGGGRETRDPYSRDAETPVWGPLIWRRYTRWRETCYRYTFLSNLLKESVR